MAKKVVIIGLDCATPQLVFDRFRDKLPNFSALMDQGVWGKFRSCTPPITCPAWAVMTTGRDPGALGVYGFRHRVTGTYDDMWIATDTRIKEKRLWDYLGEAGKKVIMLGVPQTFPAREVNGLMVNSFLAASKESDYTYPLSLKKEIDEVVPEYMIDVDGFRSNNKEELLEGIFKMTRERFKLARHFLKNKEWDFFMMVEMGPDRLHHAFWKYFDPRHPKYEPGNKFEDCALDYYQLLDKEIGSILSQLDNETMVMVVSDHGAKEMRGCLCINEWLIENGYLTLKKYPDEVTSLDEATMIDWSKTKAWGWGGYYARLYLNVAGREPQGIIEAKDYEKERQKLREGLLEISDDQGRKMESQISTPEELYPVRNGDPADLFCFFDNLYWRSAGTVGHQKIHIFENDTGPDDAVHDWDGIFLARGRGFGQGKNLEGINLLDISPTLLNYYGLLIPRELEGKIINNFS